MKNFVITQVPQQEKKVVTAMLLLLIVCLPSCKKSGYIEPASNNEFNATVVFSSGSTININAKSSKAKMGCSFLGGGTFVAGTNDANAAVYISVYDLGLACVSRTGTYSFSCEYRPDVTSQTSPIYESRQAGFPGTITFTSINQGYMEGHFNSVCRYNSDSVIVTGTFKGDKMN